ncbi:thermonuclease family protein [Ensifer adhaerens]|uniref:thermonuclease family protein n=1 Tax=Ensifer canadensis TaxID=555315 RepID=UPI00148F61F1|nr:thermonuclease family protein [Ensifer canadensis]NOV19672.1 thermonuclease family protein [Ensifer canadensis]
MLKKIALAALLLSPSSAFSSDTISGRASVIDGDTIEIAGKRLRLHGVDAPESWQKCSDGDGGTYRCGKMAANELDRFLAVSRPIHCDVIDRDRYQRLVGICFRADGREVNRWLVESGNALDWERYSRGNYAGAELTARSSSIGIWRGAFQLPCEARAERFGHKPAC